MNRVEKSLRSGNVRGDAFMVVLLAMAAIAEGQMPNDIYADAEDPATVSEAMSGPYTKEWREAIDKKHKNLKKHNVYKWAEKPKNEPLMDSKTVLRVKRGAQGEITRFKVRCCARGFTQIPGVHFDPAQARAGIVRFNSIQLLLAIAGTASSASVYLHRPIRERIYICVRHRDWNTPQTPW